MTHESKKTNKKTRRSFYAQPIGDNGNCISAAPEDLPQSVQTHSASLGLDIEWQSVTNGESSHITLSSVKIITSDVAHEVLPILSTTLNMHIVLYVANMDKRGEGQSGTVVHNDVGDSEYYGGHIEIIQSFIGNLLSAATNIEAYKGHCDYIDNKTNSQSLNTSENENK